MMKPLSNQDLKNMWQRGLSHIRFLLSKGKKKSRFDGRTTQFYDLFHLPKPSTSMLNHNDLRIPTIILSKLLTGQIIESDRIEYHASIDHADYLKDICAFANDIDDRGGGLIIIGIKKTQDGSDRLLNGVDPRKIDKMVQTIQKACHVITPCYMPMISIDHYDSKAFIVIRAYAGSSRPYGYEKYSNNTIPSAIYIRKNGHTIGIDEPTFIRLKTIFQTIPFDDRIHAQAPLSALDHYLIQNYLLAIDSPLYAHMDTIDFDQLCHRLNIIGAIDGIDHPKNSGLLFFSSTPHQFIPGSYIQLRHHYKHNRYTYNYAGPLDTQLQTVTAYIKNAIETLVIKVDNQAEALRIKSYPLDAIQNTIAIALIHKEYQIDEPITIDIHTNDITITLPCSNHIIDTHHSIPVTIDALPMTNRSIADYLKSLGITTTDHHRVEHMVQSLKQNGNPCPCIDIDSTHRHLSITIPIHVVFETLNNVGP